MRMSSYILWALSVVAIIIGAVSRLTLAPIGGIGARAFLGLAMLLQLYAMTLLLMELIQHRGK